MLARCSRPLPRVALVALTLYTFAAGCASLLGIDEPGDGVGGTDAGNGPDADQDLDAAPAPDARTHGLVQVTLGGSGLFFDGDAGPRVVSDPLGIACPGDCEESFPVGTDVILTSTILDDGFTGFRAGGCTGSPSCTLDVTTDHQVFARWWRGLNHIFVTSTVRAPGSFDGGTTPGLLAIDAMCQELADAAGVPGTFRAWLPDGTTTAPVHVQTGATTLVSGWLRTDGEPFAFRFQDLTVGVVFYPPRLDEWGQDVGDDALVLTETNADGSPAPGSHCNGYTSEATPTPVVVGEAAGGTVRYTASGTSVSCATPTRFYCLGADLPTAIFLPVADDGSFVFVTAGSLPGGAGIVAADALCAMEANAAVNALELPPRGSQLALVTPAAGKPVSDRFKDWHISGPVQRPDGVIVAADVDDFIAGAPLRAAPNVTAQRSYVNADVWMGAGSLAAPNAGDCKGWTSSASTDFGAGRPAATTRGATFFETDSCDQPKRVLCLHFQGAVAKPAARTRR